MGSSGTGSFGNYKPDYMNNKKNAGQGQGQGQGIKGIASGGEIECPDDIAMIILEDVAISEYYNNHHAVPQKGESVYLDSHISNGRLVVRSTNTQEIIGNLPTKYNYLITCLQNGVNYNGAVVYSDVQKIPSVVVTLHA